MSLARCIQEVSNSSDSSCNVKTTARHWFVSEKIGPKKYISAFQVSFRQSLSIDHLLGDLSFAKLSRIYPCCRFIPDISTAPRQVPSGWRQHGGDQVMAFCDFGSGGAIRLRIVQQITFSPAEVTFISRIVTEASLTQAARVNSNYLIPARRQAIS
jgi:hypothetical protein